MVILKCKECGSSDTTLNTTSDVKCNNCGYEGCMETFELDEINENSNDIEAIDILSRKVVHVKSELNQISRNDDIIFKKERK